MIGVFMTNIEILATKWFLDKYLRLPNDEDEEDNRILSAYFAGYKQCREDEKANSEEHRRW